MPKARARDASSVWGLAAQSKLRGGDSCLPWSGGPSTSPLDVSGSGTRLLGLRVSDGARWRGVYPLFGSIAAEAILVRVAIRLYRLAGERSLLLGILFAVGLHFLPMAVAFGPACAALGVALCACAGFGLWVRPAIGLNTLWASDGIIKMAFGATMFLAR